MTRWMMTSMLILTVSLLTSRAAHAQEKGQTGLTMGYPASVGMVWQASDGFALRPEFSFGTTSIDSSSAGLRDTTSLGVGLSGLFYVGRWESLSTYVSPRFVYNRLSIGPSGPSTESNTYSLTGSFGTQYAMNRRFGVFGEVGLGYSHGDQQFETGSIPFTSTTTTDSWSTRTGIGVLVYF
jgi:hypothetical protein